MPNITTLTRAQIIALNQGQLRAAINQVINGWTKREMVLFLLDSDRIVDTPIITRRVDGQVETYVEVERDMETDVRIGGRRLTYTYYPTGEVDTIVISQRDAADKEKSKRTIKHFKDGRQPEVTG